MGIGGGGMTKSLASGLYRSVKEARGQQLFCFYGWFGMVV